VGDERRNEGIGGLSIFPDHFDVKLGGHMEFWGPPIIKITQGDIRGQN
jgi:hypothetical protein